MRTIIQRLTNKPLRYALVTLATWALLGAGVASAASSSCIGDVVFLMDNTGSMGGMISSTRRQAKKILKAIAGEDAAYPQFKGLDVEFAVATYWGDPREQWGTKLKKAQNSYKVNKQLTNDKAAVEISMGEWGACSSPGGCGGDWEEANMFALHQIATEGGVTDGKGYSAPGTAWAGIETGADTDEVYASCGYTKGGVWIPGKMLDPDDGNKEKDVWKVTDPTVRKSGCPTGAVGWRNKSARVVVWFGDAPSWNTTVTREETVAVLNQNNIIVTGINTQSKGSGFDTCHNLQSGSFGWWGNCGDSGLSSVGDPTYIAAQTDGTIEHDVTGDKRVIDAILRGVASGLAQSGSATAVSFSGNTLTVDSTVFIPKFNAKKWSGDLEAWTLDPKTGLFKSKLWNAASLLDKLPNPKHRRLLTYRNGKGVPFNWDNIDSAQQNDLRTSMAGALQSTSNGKARLDYIAGDRENEMKGKNFRVRASRMSDIWHSSPVYVGKPRLSWINASAKLSSSYLAFQKKQVKRDAMVYVGSNGGMLHGFDAKTGAEKLAYIPGSLYSSAATKGYHPLTDPIYAHKPVYVDATPSVSDTKLKGEWKTVLVGGLGRGGRGMFALDVTDPNEFINDAKAAKTVLWEFSNKDDGDLGFTHSEATIAYLNNDKWAAVFGNGPCSDAATCGNGEAQLFIVYLDGPAGGVWNKGLQYHKISTGAGNTTKRNGLFAPRLVDLNADGTVDFAYAGDLHGNVWRFDLRGKTASGWTGKALFNGDSKQPITVRPTVTNAPSSVTAFRSSPDTPGVMVLVGTGTFIEPGDKALVHDQYFLGLYDSGKEISGGLSDLAKQSFDAKATGNNRVTKSSLVVDYSTGKKSGWYIELKDLGERVVSPAKVRHGHVLFNSIIPDRSECSSSGVGWEWLVQIGNGGSAKNAQYDHNGDGKVTTAGDATKDSSGETVGYAAKKVIGKGLLATPSVIGNLRFTPTSEVAKTKDMLTTVLVTYPTTSGRVSWQELHLD